MFDEIITMAGKFNIEGRPIGIECNDSGNINKTFVVTYVLPDKSRRRYVIQKINTVAFTEPYKVMKNIEMVGKAIALAKVERNDNRQSLTTIRTKNGDSMVSTTDQSGEKEYYRAYNCIEEAISYDNCKDEQVIYNTGRAFGNFQSMLAELPIDELEDTIPDFHNTAKRYDRFIRDVEKDTVDRVELVIPEINFVKERKDLSTVLTSALEAKSIPLRVCHNDTKISNVMMNMKGSTCDFETVIDWDTIMPGCAGYDFGDGIRSAAATAPEDEQDLTKVSFDINLLKAYIKGYLEEMAPYMDETEVNLLATSIKVITYELGIRFLNDYINGDTYFTTRYPGHNLDRARNQFKLLTEFEDKFEEINEFVIETYKSIVPQAHTLKKDK